MLTQCCDTFVYLVGNFLQYVNFQSLGTRNLAQTLHETDCSTLDANSYTHLSLSLSSAPPLLFCDVIRPTTAPTPKQPLLNCLTVNYDWMEGNNKEL